jgi:hypothetical protein
VAPLTIYTAHVLYSTSRILLVCALLRARLITRGRSVPFCAPSFELVALVGPSGPGHRAPSSLPLVDLSTPLSLIPTFPTIRVATSTIDRTNCCTPYRLVCLEFSSHPSYLLFEVSISFSFLSSIYTRSEDQHPLDVLNPACSIPRDVDRNKVKNGIALLTCPRPKV